jgi:ParB family chromosome partitioning protein
MLKEMAEDMGNALDTVVKIQLGRKKGQLIIEFGNVADLRRIADRIQGKN